MTDVRLTYRRTGETFSGDIDGAAFADISYAAMMASVALRLQDSPERGLIVQRSDREGLLPVTLDMQQVAVLREDPVRFIKAHSPAPRVVDLTGGKKAARAQAVISRGLRAGHDALADALGDRVYLKLRGIASACRVEHVATGRWVSLSDFLREFTALGESHRDWDLHFATEDSGWISINIELLLRFELDRFYLPREWNPNGNWVTKAQLQELYDCFKKEKNACLSEMKTAR